MSYEDRISIATPEGVDLDLTLAGLGSRSVARLIDQAIQFAVLLALAFLAALAGGSDPGGDGGLSETGDGSGALALAVTMVLIFLVQFGYDVLFEVLASGRTPGKRWSGLRVVRVDGAPVGFVTSAVRNLVRIVDSLPGVYAVGMIAILASRRNQRLGDMAASTVVVRERKARVTAAWTAPAERTAPPQGTAPAGMGPPRSGERAGAEWRRDQPPWGGGRGWGPGRAISTDWDVSAVTAEEVATVRRFLERRAGLVPDARYRLAHELAARLRPKVVGPAPDLAPETFLEEVAAAKAARG